MSDVTAQPGRDDRAGVGARVRIDKWLWAARLFKTRALAQKAIESGQVRIDDIRVKPAHPVHAGQRVSVRKGGIVVEAVVIGMADRRGNAAAAALLYTETPESVVARERLAAERRAAALSSPRFAGRPTKRDRRKLEDFLNEP